MAGKWLSRLKKVVGYGLAVTFALLAVAVTLTVGWRPFIGPNARPLTTRRFEATPSRLERGKYLSENVLGCFACHSKFDLKNPETSYAAAKKGGGNSMEHDGLPWLVAPNITSDLESGVGSWSDDALARAIREGVSRDGRALFPAMPYTGYRNLSDEDLASVIVFLRTLDPVRNTLPKSEIPFPLSRLVNNVPRPISTPVGAPDRSDPVKYGEYLVRVADCAGCHTPRDGRGRPIAGLEYGGGTLFAEGRIATANITPDPTGISYYDEALFLEVIRTGHVKARVLSPAMPWWMYRNMKDEDLKPMFAYLRALKPVEHRVDNTEAPTFCKLCQQKHGLGERN